MQEPDASYSTAGIDNIWTLFVPVSQPHMT